MRQDLLCTKRFQDSLHDGSVRVRYDATSHHDGKIHYRLASPTIMSRGSGTISVPPSLPVQTVVP